MFLTAQMLGLTACDEGQMWKYYGFPTGPIRHCADLTAAEVHWRILGFSPTEILNPDAWNPPELTAILHVGDVKSLRLMGSGASDEDCSDKAVSVDWSSSSPEVARWDVAGIPRTASLAALRPGDTVIAATVTFRDGTPPMLALPWSYTNRSSGYITVVRVDP